MEGMLERNTIRVDRREGFVQTPIAAGTFIRRGNPVTGVLQSNRVEHRFYRGFGIMESTLPSAVRQPQPSAADRARTISSSIRLFRFKDSFTMAEPQAQPQNVDLEAKADNYENDLALRAESILSSTVLINSSILRYREENRRTYYAYKVSIIFQYNRSRTFVTRYF